MLSLARGEDILCRYGGEEFVLVMGKRLARTMLERAEKIWPGREEPGDRVRWAARRSRHPVRGIAMFSEHGENGQAVLQSCRRRL